MGRLTAYDKENAYVKKCFEIEADTGGCPDMCSDVCHLCEHNLAITNGLAAYEETGFSPEGIEALKAERERLATERNTALRALRSAVAEYSADTAEIDRLMAFYLEMEAEHGLFLTVSQRKGVENG